VPLKTVVVACLPSKEDYAARPSIHGKDEGYRWFVI